MRHLITLIILLGAVSWLSGQEAIPQQPKRWHFTGQVGLNTYSFYPSSIGIDGSALLLGELGYRLHRHFDVGLQVGFQRESISMFSRIEPASTDFSIVRTSWNSRKLNFFAGLQARLNYRIGQGDLSLSGAYGLVRHSNLVRARSSMPFSARLRMAPLTHGYHNVHLGYTYWARPQFGLMIGFNVFKPRSSNLSRNVENNDENSPRYIIADAELEGMEVTEEELRVLRSLVDGSSRHYITVGLTVRIF